MKTFLFLLSLLSAFTGFGQKDTALTFGQLQGDEYSNEYFDLVMKFDTTWFTMDQEQLKAMTNAGKELIKSKNADFGEMLDLAMLQTVYLFGISQYEQGAPVDYNPSFLMLAENLSNAPGVKKGEDYLFHTKNALKQTGMDYTFGEPYDEVNGFAVLSAELAYMGIKIKQHYVTKVSDGYALSCILSFTDDDQKGALYEMVNSIKMK
ncbi:hypothetical protein [Marinoscillum sp.]|uniref:hypothetical protein n=1 Tax=Marinoscillum sp. TaxID=2024838 RepID=UPI003BAA25C2